MVNCRWQPQDTVWRTPTIGSNLSPFVREFQQSIPYQTCPWWKMHRMTAVVTVPWILVCLATCVLIWRVLTQQRQGSDAGVRFGWKSVEWDLRVMKLGWVWATKKLWLLLFLFPVVGVSQDDDLREGWQRRSILSSVFNRLASLSIATKSGMDKLDTLAPWNMFWSNFSRVLFIYLVCLSGKVFWQSFLNEACL